MNLTCDTTASRPRLLLGDGTLQVAQISLENGTMRVFRKGDMQADGVFIAGIGEGSPYALSTSSNELILTGCNVVATLQENRNIISACASVCTNRTRGDIPAPGGAVGADGKLCAGIGCCQAPLVISNNADLPTAARSMSYYDVEFTWFSRNRSADAEFLPTRVLVAELGWFSQDTVTAVLLNQAADRAAADLAIQVPVILDWVLLGLGSPNVHSNGAILSLQCPKDVASSICRSNNTSCTARDRGYTCSCNLGYQGNPYIISGCQDIDECKHPRNYGCYGSCTNSPGSFMCRCPNGHNGNPSTRGGCNKPFTTTGWKTGVGLGLGSVGLLIVVFVMVIPKIRNIVASRDSKRKFFKQNRGQLLQQLVSQNTDIAERMIITLDELEKATNKFDQDHEFGAGGHGTVYKGTLPDQRVVAIKKSKIVVQQEIDEFINEVVILLQINHKNIVRLLGCCLEAEVPLLVYEFISNGTLYNHLHDDGRIPLSWGNRLRVGAEIAKAIAYLHSATSISVIHRDIKSTNILLDDNMAAKVSDFGASRHVQIDKTGLTTKVQGTIGYLDPMYYQTGRLTEKSDVYSFGVLLIELLTRKKPFSYFSAEGGMGLVQSFATLIVQGNLSMLLDPQVMEEGGEEIIEVATIAATCIKPRGEDRPTMRQVEMALEGIRASKMDFSGCSETSEPDDNNIERVISVTIEERHLQGATRSYSLEEQFLISARFPR